jgi:hypothetical protein
MNGGATVSGSKEDSEHNDKFTILVKTRKYVRQRITKLCNKVGEEFHALNSEEKQAQLSRLRELHAELKVLDSSIVTSLISSEADDANIDQAIDEQEAYEDRVHATLATLQSVSTATADNSMSFNGPDVNEGSIPNINRGTKLRLPELPLPIYSNSKGEDLDMFLYSFESIIGKHNLGGYEKFVYLRNQLSKAPRVLIDSLDISEQSFDTAESLLVQAFASSTTQKYSAIKRLSELKLDMSGDPYNFVGEMRTILNSFKNLKIDVNTILNYFIWTGLNSNFQTHLIQIANNNKPSLEQIESNIFEATERYIRSLVLANHPKPVNCNNFKIKESEYNSTNLAVNVKTKSYNICNLCKHDKNEYDHKLFKCIIYDTAIKKVEKLKLIGSCSKCSFQSHDTKNCRFVFSSNCKTCNGKHMTFLCLKSAGNYSSNGHGGSKNGNTEVTTNLNWSEALATSSNDENILLPTFSCNLISRNNSTLIRVLKDGGCQKNFIKKSLVQELKLPVVDNITINIHGFNSSKTIKTEVVEVSLRVKDRIISVKAVVVPDIRTSIAVPNLSRLVHEFSIRGYTVADTMLDNDLIDNIGLVLGADSDHYFDMKYVKFGGNESPSCYIDTKLGVVFTGCIERMISNLQYLPRDNVNSRTSVRNKGTDNGGNKKEELDNVFSSCHTMLATYDKIELNGECTVDNFSVLDSNGDILENELMRATSQALDKQCSNLLNCDTVYDPVESEINKKLINYTLRNTSRNNTGRLVMPLMWNAKICHRLGQNYILSKQILQSNVRKLKKTERLDIYDKVFKDQQSEGIIERIDDIDQFVSDHPECSILPHMGVFKPDRDTTKCRVVFLSNLCEGSNSCPSVNHNQAMLPGPCLNHKITVSLIGLRFDKYLVTFDLRKAFLSILLREEDQNRLLFLWYKNISKGDFSLIGYKNLRLTFGLRSSPCILMLALYKILMLDIDNDCVDIINLKRQIFHNIYMDNGGITVNSVEQLQWCYDRLPGIFEPYQFFLQQFVTNYSPLQAIIDDSCDKSTSDNVKLLGLLWNRVTDKIMPQPLKLDIVADSKRLVLRSINSVYDIFGIYGPLLNRARLFLQKLQRTKDLEWDTKLSLTLQREWSNIVKQANSVPIIEIDRFVGSRDSEYSLVAFTDASLQMYGVVIYIYDIQLSKLTYLLAKSRVVTKSLETKSIPSLEFNAIAFGVQVMIDLYQDLCGQSAVIPLRVVNLKLYTDSMVALHWLNSYSIKFDKMQKMSVFIMNRLTTIDKLCLIKPICFGFTEGYTNPADAISRPFSYKKLSETCYHEGPNFLTCADQNLISREHEIAVTIPNPLARCTEEVPDTEDVVVQMCVETADIVREEHVVPLDRFSRFKKLANVTKFVLMFINNIKIMIASKDKLRSISILENYNLYNSACNRIILIEQKKCFPEIFEYFENKTLSSDIPSLITRYNLFVSSSDFLIRIKSKFKYQNEGDFPILLPKENVLTNLIVDSTHRNLCHAGVYSVLKSLRAKFWILHYYSVVRKVIRQCTKCRRYNNKPLTLNQSAYRDFRVAPPNKPFSSVFLDYMGPWYVNIGLNRTKVWVLIITCLFTRAVNLRVCLSADTSEFLKAVQLHIYQYGVFQECRADLGSQISSGFSLVRTFLDDFETNNFFQEHSIKYIKLEQYCKGNSALGSLVESLVKQCKLLIQKTIGQMVLDIFDFKFIIEKVVHLINRRPIAFKDGLRANEGAPDPITPEMLIHGYELVSLNIIPSLQSTPLEDDPDWREESSRDTVRENFNKLKIVKDKLVEEYNSEFLHNLILQATDRKERFKPVKHCPLKVGDIVLLKDVHLKPTNYPMGRVLQVDVNDLGETTAAQVLKGASREKVYRHASTIIPLLRADDSADELQVPNKLPSTVDEAHSNVTIEEESSSRSVRPAAIRAAVINKSLFDRDLA